MWNLGNLYNLMHVYATMLSFKTTKSRNLAILKFFYRGTKTAVLPLMVTLIIDCSHFVFTQHIILRNKRSNYRRISHNQSPSKCGLNDNVTISKILITYGGYSYYLNHSHD
jgi:hypothetical protein